MTGNATGEILHWDITGEYITNTVREWFYFERKPFKVIHELLECSLVNPEVTSEELNIYIDDILTFKRKIAGSTRTDDYGLYPEDNMEELQKKYPEYKYYEFLKQDMKIPFAECPYGFINPYGEYIPVEWCHHGEWAADYVKTHNLYEDMLEKGYYDNTDYLVYVKNYILLENPRQEQAIIQMSDNINEKQRTTLYDYLMFYGRRKEACDLYGTIED